MFNSLECQSIIRNCERTACHVRSPRSQVPTCTDRSETAQSARERFWGRRGDGLEALEKSDESKGYRNQGGVNFAQVCAHLANTMDLQSPFITSKFGEFRAHPANFAQIRPMLFLSTIFGLTPPFITLPFVWFQGRGGRGHAGDAPRGRCGRRPRGFGARACDVAGPGRRLPGDL